MKLHVLLFFVCSISEARFGFSSFGSRISSFRPSKFIPSKLRPSSWSKPNLLGGGKKLPPPPDYVKPKSNFLSNALNGLNLGVNAASLGLMGYGMYEADRLQDKQFKHDIDILKKKHDFQRTNNLTVAAAEELKMPQVCIDCMEEFELINRDMENEAKVWCTENFSASPNFYDSEKQSCNEESNKFFFTAKLGTIFDRFGGKDNKCLKATSEYLKELKKDHTCSFADDKILRCLFDYFYGQKTEAKDSCPG